MKNVYVITGATGGMGEIITKNITKEGIILISDLNEEKLIALKKKIENDKIKCEYMICDVSNKEHIIKLANKTKELGNFKVMVHTAGVSESMKDANSVININLVGTKYLMDEFLKIANNSVFINIASMTGHMVPDSFLYDKKLLNPTDKNFMKSMKPFLQNSSRNAYAFSKKGVILLTEKEVDKWSQKNNSRILSISPGAIETPLSLSESKDNPAVNFMISKTPISRYGTPKEISDLVNFLISDKAAFITGVDVLIDGGITNYMKYNDIFGLKKKTSTPQKLLYVIYALVFILLPLLSGFNIIGIDEKIIFAINVVTMMFGSLILLNEKIKISLIILPLILYLISGLIPGYPLTLIRAVLIPIGAFLFQLVIIKGQENTIDE